MQIEFIPALFAGTTGPVARIVEQDALPADLDAAMVAGARAGRFTGKQVFEGFSANDGPVTRLTLAGLGDPTAAGRLAALEKAGAALTAKYLASGETALTIDFTGGALTANEVAAVLLGARLRAWRHDTYRTRLPEDQKPT